MYFHLLSAVLWWSITFFVIFILSPINKGGSLSILLPRIHKFIIPISTVTLISGFLLLMINIEGDFSRILASIWGKMILIGGIFSLPVYIIILIRSKTRNIKLQLNRGKRSTKSKPILPYLLFSFLSISIAIMIFIANLI
jgi:hypothetical protein